MPLSKERMNELKRQQRAESIKPKSNLNKEEVMQSNSEVVKPKHHCSLPICVICDPEKYQTWFKKTYGRYDELNKEK